MPVTNVTVFGRLCPELDLEAWLRGQGARNVLGSGQSVIGSWPGGSLRITLTQRHLTGDAFSKLALGLYAWTQSADVAVDRQGLLARVSEVDRAFGIVAEPELGDADARADAVFKLAEAVSGLLFTGSKLISSSGETLAVR